MKEDILNTWIIPFLGMAEVEMRLGNRDEAWKLLLSIIKKFPKFE